MILHLDKQGSDLATPSAAGCLLGLKTQAESWSPFGARDQMSKLRGPKGQEVIAQALADPKSS